MEDKKMKVMEALRKQRALCKMYYYDEELNIYHDNVCREYEGMKAIARIIGVTEEELAEIDK